MRAEIGGFVGSFIIGAIKDLTGSFLAGVSVLAIVALALFVTALFLKA